MVIKKIHEIKIYENDDGTKNIYARCGPKIGYLPESENNTENLKLANRYSNLINICELAKHDPELNKLLERLELYYELIKPRNNTD